MEECSINVKTFKFSGPWVEEPKTNCSRLLFQIESPSPLFNLFWLIRVEMKFDTWVAGWLIFGSNLSKQVAKGVLC